MVLDEQFPPDSEARRKLIFLLRADIRKALEAISSKVSIELVDFKRGSVIVHFRFMHTRDDAAWLEEEYIRQINDQDATIKILKNRIDVLEAQSLEHQLIHEDNAD